MKINLHVNEISFSYEKMGTKTRFEEEAKGNSEMAYLSEILAEFKERLNEKKKQFWKTTRQLIARPPPPPLKGTPGWWETVWCTSTNFELQILILKQHQIFQMCHFHKFY